MSPSGKAAGSGPAIRGFESLHPSQENAYLGDFLFSLADRRASNKEIANLDVSNFEFIFVDRKA